MTDSWQDPDAIDWAKRTHAQLSAALGSSSLAVSIVPGDGDVADVKFWVELGAIIMLDKPLIVAARPGRTVPPKLAAIADEIVYLPPGDPNEPAAIKAMSTAIDMVLRRCRKCGEASALYRDDDTIEAWIETADTTPGCEHETVDGRHQ